MAADLRLVAHAAERHAHELPIRRAGDRLPQRSLADAGGADQAQDRRLELVDALLHGQVLDDPLLDLLEPVVIFVEHFLGIAEIGVDLALLAPRQRHDRIDVVANDRRLGRHRRHEPQLFELRLGFLARVLGHARLLDLFLDLVEVGAFFHLAELFLDRFDLFVQVILALALLHLALHAAANALLDLEDVELAFDELQKVLEPRFHVEHLEYFLLLLELERKVRGDRVAEPPRFVDTGERSEDLRGNLLVQLHVLIELLDHRAAHRFRLVVGRVVRRKRRDADREMGREVDDFIDARALAAFDQHFYRAVGQLQHLEDVRDAADFVQILRRRIVLGGGLLRNQHDAFPRFHRGLEGLDRLRPSDEERNDHVGKDHDVAQRKQRKLGRSQAGFFGKRHSRFTLNSATY
jgi:hypothetical protein